MKTTLKRNIFLIVIILLNFGLDQLTKHWARLYIQGQGTIQVIGRFFELRYEENLGAFLGMGSNLPQPWKTMLLVLIPALAIIAGIIYLIMAKKVTLRQAICVACFIGGGIGNIYDRAIHSGRVTDFLNFGFGDVIRTGVLNVADLSITFGAIMLLIFQHYDEKKQKALK